MSYTSGSPSNSQIQIGIALVLRDRFSNQSREASTQIRKLHLDAKNAINANLAAVQQFATMGESAARYAAQGILYAVNDGAKFIDTMVTVQAITEATVSELNVLNNTAQTLGLRTMFSSKEIASGMQYLAMAGTTAQDIQSGMIEGAAMVANATNMALGGKGGAADMLTNTMRMFKIESAEAAIVVGDQLTKATLSSNMSMTDLAEGIKYAGADMVTLKQSLPAVAAMLGTLGNAGIQGSMAGTAISNMARYLNKSISQPTYKGAKALAAIGLSRQDFIDAKGDLVDMSIVLDKMNQATAQLTSTEKNAVFLDIFGVRGNRAATALSRDIEGYRSLLEKIQNESQGFAQSVVDKRMNSLAGSIDIFKSSLENLRTTYAQALEPVLKPVLVIAAKILSVLRDIIATPVLGPIIAGATVLITLTVGITSKIMLARAAWRLLFNDSQVSFANMRNVMFGGWNGLILKASQYKNIQAQIIAMQKANIGSNILGSVMVANPGKWFGNARMTIDKNGRPMFWQKDEKGGVKRVKPKVALGQVTPGNATSTLMGGTIGRATSTLGRVASGALGMFGGPIGLISLSLTVLPSILNKIRESNRLKREQQYELETLNNTQKLSLAEQIARAKDPNQKIADEIKVLRGIINYWGEKMHNKDPKVDVVNHITLDGQPIEGIVNRQIDKKNNQDNYNNNLR